MSINFESHTIDRRSFLKGAGVLGAAGLLSACGGSKPNSTPRRFRRCAGPQHHRR